MHFKTFDPSTAAESARPILAATQKGFGFVPNLLATMAGAPSLLAAYTTLGRLFDDTSLSPTERQVVLLTTSRINNCEYCVAAHTAIAGMQKVAANVVEAIRNDQPIEDTRLEALRRFTAAVVTSRGWPDRNDVDAFEAAGYGAQQILEVVLGVGMKTLSNYTNHIANTPLDPQFAPVAWKSVR